MEDLRYAHNAHYCMIMPFDEEEDAAQSASLVSAGQS